MPKILRLCAASILLLALVGCGSGTVSNPGGASYAEPGTAGAITVETARGPVTLPGPATKVVSLEWSLTEELLALGVTPVGNADASYNTWVTAPGAELPAEVVDVGRAVEPSIEQIAALKPDIIVAGGDIGANYDQFARIAPVLSFDYTASPQLETMKKNFTSLASAVGRRDRAADVLGRIDAAAADLAGRLARAGKAGAEYALAQGYSANGIPNIRMLTDEALAPQVLGLAGLRNGWRGRPDSWGMTTVGVESLTRLPPSVTFMSVAAEGDNPFTGALAENPVWRELDFVEQGRAVSLDAGTWVFGGPLSALQLLDEAGKALRV